MYDLSGRIQGIPFDKIIDVGRNKCGICGRIGEPNDEIFADPQIYEEFIGNTYFCKDCCIELGMFFGAVPAQTHNEVLKQLNDVQQENSILKAQLIKSEAIVDNISVQRLVSRDIISHDPSTNRYYLDVETIERSVSSPKRDNKRTEAVESDSVKPSENERPIDSASVTSNNGSSEPGVDDLLSSIL